MLLFLLFFLLFLENFRSGQQRLGGVEATESQQKVP